MKVRFHPQAWIGGYATAVDLDEPNEWDVGAIHADVESDSWDSDLYQRHANAPEWVQKWSGPFWIEVLRDE
jgi:hypothetical protein